MKKVVLVSGPLKLSGSATWILNLQRGFKQAGADVIHIVTNDYNMHDVPEDFRVFYTGAIDKTALIRLLRALRLHKWAKHFYAKIQDHLYNKAVEKILAELRWHSPIDLVIKDFTAYLPSFFNQYPVVATIHQQLSINWSSAKLREKATQAVNCFVSVSEAVKQDAEALGINVKTVIYNPIDIESVKRKSLEYSVPAPLNFIVFVGSLNANKGIFQLLEAFARLDETLSLCYVGSGKDQDALKARAAELGVSGRVTFTGFLSNPYPYIRAAKLLVLPTQSDTMGESMGYVAVEAFILDTPILVTDFKGAREFYEEEAIIAQEPRSQFVEHLAEGIKARLEERRVGKMTPGILEKMQPEAVAREFLALVETR